MLLYTYLYIIEERDSHNQKRVTPIKHMCIYRSLSLYIYIYIYIYVYTYIYIYINRTTGRPGGGGPLIMACYILYTHYYTVLYYKYTTCMLLV